MTALARATAALLPPDDRLRQAAEAAARDRSEWNCRRVIVAMAEAVAHRPKLIAALAIVYGLAEAAERLVLAARPPAGRA